MVLHKSHNRSQPESGDRAPVHLHGYASVYNVNVIVSNSSFFNSYILMLFLKLIWIIWWVIEHSSENEYESPDEGLHYVVLYWLHWTRNVYKSHATEIKLDISY